MSILVRTALLCLLVHACTPTARAASVFGSYRGYVTNERLRQDQLIKVELIHSRADDGGIKLRAILTLQFGGFDSAEYVSYHFEDVGYNLISGVLTFNQNDQEVHLSSVRIRKGVITGDLHAATGIVGPFRASNDGKTLPKNPLIAPLGGEYRGTCGEKPSALQLVTYRSTRDTTRLGNPFGVYEARGQLGKYNPSYCSRTKRDFCAYTKIEGASYNFYVGDLVLYGYPFGVNCRVGGDQLSCGECSFKRVSNEMSRPLLSEERSGQDPILEIRGKLKIDRQAPLRGQYRGYVFHEYLGLFQKVEMDVATFDQPGPDGTRLQLSATANIRFGDSDNEVISYRFDPLEFPNPVMSATFVLARPSADVDALLAVRKMGNGIIEGVWYSMIFGRVGSFVLTQNGDLPSLGREILFGSVASGYEEIGGAGVIASVLVGKGNAPIGSDNPFDPLTFGGYVWRRAGTTRKEGISGGSYDFYTGRLGILYEGGMLGGFLIPGRNPALRRLGGGFGTIMQSFPTSAFVRTNRLP